MCSCCPPHAGDALFETELRVDDEFFPAREVGLDQRPELVRRAGDELSAFATSGTPRLTDGLPTTMIDSNGKTLAVPQRLTDFTFKVIYRGG